MIKDLVEQQVQLQVEKMLASNMHLSQSLNAVANKEILLKKAESSKNSASG